MPSARSRSEASASASAESAKTLRKAGDDCVDICAIACSASARGGCAAGDEVGGEGGDGAHGVQRLNGRVETDGERGEEIDEARGRLRRDAVQKRSKRRLCETGKRNLFAKKTRDAVCLARVGSADFLVSAKF